MHLATKSYLLFLFFAVASLYLPYVLAAFNIKSPIVSTCNVNFRILVLNIFSFTFYSFISPLFSLVLLVLALMGYLVGYLIHRFKILGNSRNSRNLLIGFLIFLVSTLITSKFSHSVKEFFLDSIIQYPGAEFNFLQLVVPIGISFYSLQIISFCVEIYKGNIRELPGFWQYTLYLIFFPKIMAGPIEQPVSFFKKISQNSPLNPKIIYESISLIALGFFKKCIIALSFGAIVSVIFTTYSSYSWFVLLCTLVLFRFQLYADFSGYMDIARGSSKLLGINLERNFNNPYLALSFSDHWQRWHMSLSIWFRTYIFYPCLKYIKNQVLLYLSIMFTFLLVGFWHGIDFKYIVCWLLNGLLVVIEILIFRNKKIYFKELKLINKAKYNVLFYFLKTFKYFFTAQLVLIGIALTTCFLRADDVYHAVAYLKNIFILKKGFDFEHTFSGMSLFEFQRLIIAIGGYIAIEIVNSFSEIYEKTKNDSLFRLNEAFYKKTMSKVRPLLVIVMIVLTVYFYPVNNSNFIYLGF